ncbi:MAG TPA: phasin family protein [Janthinobacterium sp.]|jgi:phasin family protein|nr:phasin family protein [Janthinobacterium sp.]
MDVQLAFVTDLSKKLFDTAQRISQLNLNLAQELIQEAATTNHNLVAAKDVTEFASVATTQVHPAAEKMRNYQQQLTNLVANANVELTRTAEQHIPDASRTAAAVADELVRKASEETEKATQRQREVIDRMHESARRGIDGTSQQSQGQAQGRASSQAQTQGGQHAAH